MRCRAAALGMRHLLVYFFLNSNTNILLIEETKTVQACESNIDFTSVIVFL